MHGDALSAAIDAWLAEAREDDCAEIDIADRRQVDGGERLVLVADQNPWEAETHRFALLPRRDNRNQLLFLGTGHDEDRGIHYAYLDHQSSFGDDVDVPDRHHVTIWFGPASSVAEVERLNSLFDDKVQEGACDHMRSAIRLLDAIDGSVPMSGHLIDAIRILNRRMT